MISNRKPSLKLILSLALFQTSKIFLLFMISNRCILKAGRSIELKDDLVEHFDFIVISCDVWKLLYSWYSADCTIVRFMRRDQTNKRA